MSDPERGIIDLLTSGAGAVFAACFAFFAGMAAWVRDLSGRVGVVEGRMGNQEAIMERVEKAAERSQSQSREDMQGVYGRLSDIDTKLAEIHGHISGLRDDGR